VLEALYDLVDYRTGRLEPAIVTIATIAERIGRSYSAVHDALGRLRNFGFLKWIRRSRPTENKGEAGPQVEQIRNAYILTVPAELQDHVRRLLGDNPTPDCERWRREDARNELADMISKISVSQAHRDLWHGDKLLGETFAQLAAGLDQLEAQERESGRAGETGGSF